MLNIILPTFIKILRLESADLSILFLQEIQITLKQIK